MAQEPVFKVLGPLEVWVGGARVPLFGPRQGRVLAVAFHSELSGDDRVHRLFLEDVRAYAGGAERSRASQP